MFTFIYILPWRMLLLLMPGMALGYLALRRLLWPGHRRLFRLGCGAALLVWLGAVLGHTVLLRSPGTPEAFSALFDSYRRMADQPETLRECFMNLLLFFPAGLLLFDILPQKKPFLRFLTAVLPLMLLSVCIECAQYRFALGTPEADDILHNTLGAALGAGAAWLAPRAAERLIHKFKTRRSHHDHRT